MIAYLKGKIRFKGENFIVVEIGDIGYQVYLSPLLIVDLKTGQEAEFFTHQYVREDALDLYGFSTQEELSLFKSLISVSGIGPKTALGVLSVAKVKEIKNAISREDPSILTKVSGIGRKTAERVVLELKGKFESVAAAKEGGGEGDAEVIDALVGLGYKPVQAREAVRKLPSSIKEPGEKIKEALKIINR